MSLNQSFISDFSEYSRWSQRTKNKIWTALSLMYGETLMYDLFSWGRGLDPPVRQHSFVEMGHKIISTAILSLTLIQVGQLSVTGEKMCT